MAKISWIQSLAKKPASSAAIILNSHNELLIVKPNYKKGWQVPGGVLEACESPTKGCIREVKEEVNIDIKDPQLVSIVHGIQKSEELQLYDVFYFTFFVGIISDEQIKNINLQEEELDEYKFLKLEEALPLLTEALRERIKLGWEGYKNNKINYSEWSV